jgi:hypothetical protein
MIEWLNQRSLTVRLLLIAAGVVLAFALSAGVGAMISLTIQGGAPPHRGGDADRTQQRKAAAKQSEPGKQKTTPAAQEAGAEQGDDAPRQERAQYIQKIGELQDKSVEAFTASYGKFSRYDALTADDVQQMKSNQASLQDISEQVANLDPPQEYDEQYEIFSSAISELYEAAGLAYNLATDPVSATQSKFDEYDRLVNEADARLERSNEILGRDYDTLQDGQQVSPS